MWMLELFSPMCGGGSYLDRPLYPSVSETTASLAGAFRREGSLKVRAFFLRTFCRRSDLPLTAQPAPMASRFVAPNEGLLASVTHLQSRMHLRARQSDVQHSH